MGPNYYFPINKHACKILLPHTEHKNGPKNQTNRIASQAWTEVLFITMLQLNLCEKTIATMEHYLHRYNCLNRLVLHR
jgi:hypothetical protein